MGQGLEVGLAWGGAFAERRQWSFESPEEAGSLARPAAAAPLPAARLKLPPPLQCSIHAGILLLPAALEAAHPGLRAGAARLQL